MNVLTPSHTKHGLSASHFFLLPVACYLFSFLISAPLYAHDTQPALEKIAELQRLAETDAQQPGRIWDYGVLGWHHVLGGADHLLFVMGVLLLLPHWRSLLAAITSFTVAHSITLALVTLQWLNVPSALIEVLVALSLVIVAVEVVQGERQRPGLAHRWPWLICFLFGLLHGMAFGSELLKMGLPSDTLWRALLMFNVGIECGQLAFVALLLVIRSALAVTVGEKAVWLRMAPAYLVGSLGAFWVFERMSGLF